MAWIPSTGLPSGLPRRSSCLVNNIYQTCSSAERRSKRRLASRIQKGGEVTRRRSPALVPAPLFISEGVCFLFAPTPKRCVGAGTVIPWSEQFVDTVTSHPLSSWLATSTVLMQRGRGENIMDKESGRSQRNLRRSQTDH